MKIAITSQGDNLESEIDKRFGRAQGFIIYDDITTDFSFQDNNQNLTSMQGAGIQSAKTIIDAGVEVLITGNVGPKAFATLEKSGVRIFIGAKGKVQDGITDFLKDKLEQAQVANVEGHW